MKKNDNSEESNLNTRFLLNDKSQKNWGNRFGEFLAILIISVAVAVITVFAYESAITSPGDCHSFGGIGCGIRFILDIPIAWALTVAVLLYFRFVLNERRIWIPLILLLLVYSAVITFFYYERVQRQNVNISMRQEAEAAAMRSAFTQATTARNLQDCRSLGGSENGDLCTTRTFLSLEDMPECLRYHNRDLCTGLLISKTTNLLDCSRIPDKYRINQHTCIKALVAKENKEALPSICHEFASENSQRTCIYEAILRFDYSKGEVSADYICNNFPLKDFRNDSTTALEKWSQSRCRN